MILSPDLTDILATAQSDAERRFARLLYSVDGGDDAVAFHSVRLRTHRVKQEAEADFVILWRGVVIVVEVKGGGVRKHDGKWWSVDRRNEWNRLKESPMAQASGAMYALRDILREDGLGWYSDQCAVVTPDIEDLGASVEWHESHWLSKKDMTPMGIVEALDSIASKAPSPKSNVKRARIADIRKKLFGEFSRMPNIDAQRGAVLDEQSRATAGQARYLDGLARNPRLMVMGGAGTGKSLALVEGAKQEADQGRSVLITFRSPGLREYFSTLVGDREISVIPFSEVPEGHLYDAVFIDEAQDLMTAADMDKIDRMVVGGRAEGRWRMFLDRNNQAHVDGGFDEDVFELILAEAVPFDLPLNVRNTKPIVQVVQEYLGADIGDPGIVNGERLHWHEAIGAADVTYAESIAEDLMNDGVSAESIWIVDALSDVATAVNKRGVTVTSPKFAKGLEVDRVIVCNIPRVFDHGGRAAFYVATTRARVGLHIAVSKDDTRRLKELLKSKMGAK